MNQSPKSKDNENNQPKGPKCGCGRSPNGKCVGWHALSFEEYDYRKEMYETGKCDIYGNELK